MSKVGVLDCQPIGVGAEADVRVRVGPSMTFCTVALLYHYVDPCFHPFFLRVHWTRTPLLMHFTCLGL